MVVESLETLVKSIHIMMKSRDIYTAAHCKRVAFISLMIHDCLVEDLKTSYASESLFYGAFIHDIGKFVIPDDVLHKRGSFNSEEKFVMDKHPHAGFHIFKEIRGTITNQDPKVLNTISDIVLWHHEQNDGSGYPHKLCHSKIPIYSRIVSLADSLDACVTNRSYQKRRNWEEVISEDLTSKNKIRYCSKVTSALETSTKKIRSCNEEVSFNNAIAAKIKYIGKKFPFFNNFNFSSDMFPFTPPTK